MSNRNLNGLNSSVRSLNGLSTQLKDGNAIKVSNRNEINVNMKTNTLEQTNINDTDLFLLSDTTGENIKYITGINLKQKALLHLEGGTNINLTTNVSNGDTIINLDDNIDTDGSITCKNLLKLNNSGSGNNGGIISFEKTVNQTTFPSRYKQIIRHGYYGGLPPNGADVFEIVAEDDSSNQRVLIQILSTSHIERHRVNFNLGDLTNVYTLNEYRANLLTLNNTSSQYLIKDNGVNLAVNSILSVGSNGKISSTTPTIILSNLIAGDNLTKSSNTINLDTALTGITNINSYIANVFEVNNTNQQYLIKDVNLSVNSILSVGSNGRISSTTPTTILGNLIAGNNLTKTGNTINLDDSIDTAGSITCKNFVKINNTNTATSSFGGILNLEGSVPQISYPFRYKQQIFHTDIGDAYQIIAEDNNSNQRLLFQLHSGTNATTTHTVNFNTANLTGINNINTYVANVLTVNNSNSQFLIKDTSVGAFSSGDFLTINSSNKVDNISRLDLNNSIVSQVFASNGLIRTLITNNGYSNISISTTPMINIDDTMTLVNTSGTNGGHALLKIQAGSEAGFQPKIQLFQDNTVRTQLQYDKANNKFFINAPTGEVHLSAYGGTASVEVNNQNVEIKTDNNIRLKVQSTQVDINTDLDMNGNDLVNVVQINADNNATGSITFNSNGTTKLQANGDLKLQSGSTNSGATDIVVISSTLVDMNRKAVIQPSTDIYTNDEFMLHVKPFQGKDCRVCIESDTSNSGGESHNPSLIFKQDGGAIKMEQGLNANNQFYFFHPQSSATWSRFRFHCGSTATDSNGQPTDASLKLSIEKEQVVVFKKLSVIKDNSALQSDSNDIFTVRNAGFVKAILHSDNNICELAFKTNNQQSTLVYTTGGHFSITTQNDINLVNNSGKCIFQGDRNLVIYNTDGGAVFATNTSTSERKFKDNIVSLDLETSYNTIKQLNPVSFVYKEDPNNHKKGFIVDEIEDKIPECLKEITNCDCEDMKSTLLFKEDIVPDLVASVKFLINKVETLEQQLLTQSNLISNLQSQINI